MKQSRFKFYLGLVAVLLISAYCKKPILPEQPKPVTKTDMLVYSRWKLVAQGFDINSDGSIDLDDTPSKPCVLDNLVFFYKDGKGSFDQGPTKCDVNHSQSRRFEWVFTTNESMIIVDGQEYKILSLTEEDFVVSYVDLFTLPGKDYILMLSHL